MQIIEEKRTEAIKALEEEFENDKEYVGYDGRNVSAEWWIDNDSKDEFLSGETDTVKCRVLPQGCDEEEKFSMTWNGLDQTYYSWIEE